MQKLKLKHLVAIRWFHWINFPLLFLMIWSGILIYWAYPIYHLGPIVFFPKWFYSALHIDHRLADGMALHFFFMWFFVINGLAYVTYTLVSGEWRFLVPRSWSAFRDAWQVVLHDLHLRKEVPAQDKYNAAQQISYTAIVVMGVGSVFNGIRDLQARATGMARLAVRRLSECPSDSLSADRRVRSLLHRPCNTGRSRRLEQFPKHGYRVRSCENCGAAKQP